MIIPLVSALALLPSTPRVGAPATPAQLSPAARPAHPSEKNSFSASRRAALAGGAATLLCRAQRAVAGGINSGAPRLQDEKEDWAAGLSKETPQAQVKAGYAYLGKLLERMDEITAAEGGDGVRRYLGTVGTTSPVFGIQKVFLKLADVIEPKDPELYFETLERMVTKISDADAEAYAANFVTFSSAKGKPEDFYARAAKQVVDARKEWLVLLQQLGLDS